MTDRMNAHAKTQRDERLRHMPAFLVAFAGLLLAISGFVALWGWPVGAIAMGLLVFAGALSVVNARP